MKAPKLTKEEIALLTSHPDAIAILTIYTATKAKLLLGEAPKGWTTKDREKRVAAAMVVVRRSKGLLAWHEELERIKTTTKQHAEP